MTSSKRVILAMLGFIVSISVVFATRADEIIQQDMLRNVLTKNGAEGAFVGYDVAAGRMFLINASRALQRFSPASTFKIANSLIALETGVIKDENEIIPYRSDDLPLFKEWPRDMSMRDAIKMSNVPIYQELARRVGLARYREWLARLSYGNREISEAINRFWLDGSLAISAVEQVYFITALAQRKLPMSIRSQDIVRDILKYETVGDHRIYAKTGWCAACRPQIGWWVGWVERKGRIFAFALNIDIARPEDLDKRIPIAREFLSKLDAL